MLQVRCVVRQQARSASSFAAVAAANGRSGERAGSTAHSRCHISRSSAPQRDLGPGDQESGLTRGEDRRPQRAVEIAAQFRHAGRLAARQQRAPVQPERLGQVTRCQLRRYRRPVRGDLAGEPVRAGSEHLAAEQSAQPYQLRAQRARDQVVGIEQVGQLVAGQPGRAGGQDDHDLAVPRAQPEGAGADRHNAIRSAQAADADLRDGLTPAGADLGSRSCARRHEGPPGQLGLGHPRGRPDHRDGLRRVHRRAAGDVDDAEDRVRPRLVHRCRGAAPALHGADEVLRRLDGHRGIQAQRRPGRVGARVALVPLCALDEPDRLGAAQDGRLAAHPEQPPALVRHGQDAVAVLGGPAGHVVQQREDLGQRVPRPGSRRAGRLRA